jgi:hypothetical protein
LLQEAAESIEMTDVHLFKSSVHELPAEGDPDAPARSPSNQRRQPAFAAWLSPSREANTDPLCQRLSSLILNGMALAPSTGPVGGGVCLFVYIVVTGPRQGRMR